MRPAPISPAKPDDLAAADEEVGVLADQAVLDLRVADAPVLDLEEDLADLRLVVREPGFQRPAHHALDDAVLVDAVGLDVERLDRLAVADDGDRIRDLLDLVELVGNDDGGDAAALEPEHEVQQVLGVGFVQRGRGLVQDQELHGLVERLGDLDQLLLADADFLDGGVRILAEAYPCQQFGGAGPGLGPVDHAALGRLVAEEDVLHDRQFRDEREFLVDDHDAGVLAGPDVLELLDFVLVDDVPGVGAERVNAREDLHQGGLAGAVLTADGVDLAGLHPQAHLGQGFNAGELFGDGTHLENYRIAVRVEGRHLPLRLQCMTSLSAPANRRAV